MLRRTAKPVTTAISARSENCHFPLGPSCELSDIFVPALPRLATLPRSFQDRHRLDGVDGNMQFRDFRNVLDHDVVAADLDHLVPQHPDIGIMPISYRPPTSLTLTACPLDSTLNTPLCPCSSPPRWLKARDEAKTTIPNSTMPMIVRRIACSPVFVVQQTILSANWALVRGYILCVQDVLLRLQDTSCGIHPRRGRN